MIVAATGRGVILFSSLPHFLPHQRALRSWEHRILLSPWLDDFQNKFYLWPYRYYGCTWIYNEQKHNCVSNSSWEKLYLKNLCSFISQLQNVTSFSRTLYELFQGFQKKSQYFFLLAFHFVNISANLKKEICFCEYFS